MKITQNDNYEEIALNFQCLDIAWLNEVLKNHGVTDKNLRREICAEYFFGSGNFIDQYWFKVNGKKFYPRIDFVERVNDEEESEEDLLYVSTGLFEFHENAHGNIDWYFDDQDEDASEIEKGVSGVD